MKYHQKTAQIDDPPNRDRISFSPIKIEDPHPPPGVNLTGLPRRIKDCCADVFNANRRWQKTKLEGAKIIKRIAQRRQASLIENNLFELCDKLLQEIENFQELVDNIVEIRRNFESLKEIDQLTSPNSSEVLVGSIRARQVPFISFSIDDFLVKLRIIESAYKKELMFKRGFIKMIPKQTDPSVFTFASICWNFDTHIEEQCDSSILSLIAECGF